MFICDKCKKSTKIYEKPNKNIYSYRKKTYVYGKFMKEKGNKKVFVEEITKNPDSIIDSYKKSGFKLIKKWNTHGKEIEKEFKYCDKCNDGGKNVSS